MASLSLRTRRGFSLIELVIVVAIIGVIGAIAIPRISRSAEDAPQIAYATDLQLIEDAIERYAAEHLGKYPTQALFVHQLTKFTDIDGRVSFTKGGKHIFGPYLRSMPQIFVKNNSGSGGDSLADTLAAGEVKITDPVSGKDLGWRFNPRTGKIRATAAIQLLTGDALDAPISSVPIDAE